MILIEKAKYSCVECIRGHRSSQCKHHLRPLLQVRSKGRPNIQNNPNYRIAVFAKQIDDSDNVIRVVRASMKYIIDFKTSDIIGPYVKESQIKRPQLMINENSFINTTSCCSKGLMRNQSCGCNHTSDKSKILKTYFNTHKKKFKFIDNNDEARQESLKDQINKSLKLSAPCECNDDCKCDNCIVHNNSNFEFELTNELNSAIREINDLEYSQKPVPLNMPDTIELNQLQDQNNSTTDITPNACNCPDNACMCSNCETHGIIDGIKLDDIFKNIDYRLLSM